MGDQASLSKDEIQQLIEIALLKNNDVMYGKLNASIEHNGEKITQSVNEKTGMFLTQLTTMATNQGTLQKEVSDIKSKMGNLWAKFTGIAAAVATFSALITFFITQLIK